MTDSRARRAFASFGAIALLAMSAATAQVASGTTGIDASGSFAREVEACRSGKSPQDLATCLQEARNARADKQRGVLGNGASYDANALARCEALAGDDKTACQARVMGHGSASGSVAGGGVLREIETVVPPQSATPATPATIEPGSGEPVRAVPAR